MSASFNTGTNSSELEKLNRSNLFSLFSESPLPPQELMSNLALYMNRQSISRLLFINHLYTQILDVHGVIFDLGTRWGTNMSLFSSFRGIYEPYNYSRKIVGFDTFSGFLTPMPEDGTHAIVSEGGFNVLPGTDAHLNSIMKCHENESPLSHIQKYSIVKGDACETVEKYLSDHPETIVSFAYFDFDLYEPTMRSLSHIKPFLTKGSIIAFDELNCSEFPGETLALKEILGLGSYAIKRSPLTSLPSYIVID